MFSKMIAHFKNVLLRWLSIAVMVLPSCIKIPIYRKIFGYKIGRHVKIGLSWITVDKMEVGDNVIISSLVRFKKIPDVKIGDHTTIGFGCTFSSTYEFTSAQSLAERGNRPCLNIGSHCGISMFHYFDIQDAFNIGKFTTIAGKGSVFFTHYLDVVKANQAAKPIRIGNYCMIGSNVLFCPGASISDFCVVGMGAVITKQFAERYCFIAGNPANKVKELPEDAAYFTRSRGWIGTYASPPW